LYWPVRHLQITEDQSATGDKQELADSIIKQGIIESISVRHVGRLLEEAEVKPHALSILVNPPLKTQNLMQKWRILLVYI
jgi:putative transposase